MKMLNLNKFVSGIRSPALLCLIFFTILGKYTAVATIWCYECNSSHDNHCTETIDLSNSNLELKNCSNIYDNAYCVKTTGIFRGEVGTTRFCSSQNLGNICDFQQRMGDVRAYRSCIYTCSGNGCNSAAALKLNFVYFLFLMLATGIYYFKH